MGDLAFFDVHRKFMRLSELVHAFKIALKQSKQIAKVNPRLAVGQGFIDTKHSKYRLELLLPLIVEFPNNSSSFYIFAMAFDKSQEQENIYILKFQSYAV